MYTVYDKGRQMTFQGDLLAHSSSHQPGSLRWIEFSLYRTVSGQYVLARTGHSTLFHAAGCRTVARNHLAPAPVSALPAHYLPCGLCSPDPATATEVYPEQERPTAHLNSDARGVVDSLWRDDHTGTRYLTDVARRLLEAASARDPDVERAYTHEHIA